ncbi:PrsW family glutamic-type intramembrane protease [Kiritimatiellota bacterium B12222]|nr:PrsW family glutamic-type intramembrane protease [Kiritimatiellota bacterium B12222]
MHPTLRFLHDLSYSSRGIRQSCLVILLIGFSLAAFMGTALQLLLPSSEQPMDVIAAIYEHHLILTTPHHRDLIKQLPPEDREMWESYLLNPLGGAQVLSKQLTSGPPPLGQNFALGLYELREGNYEKALQAFKTENSLYPNSLVRSTELNTALRIRDLDLILSYRQNASYADVATPRYYYIAGISLKNWPLIFQNFWTAQYQNLQQNLIFTTFCSGAIWTVLLLSLTYQKLPRSYVFLVPAALALGWMSTWPTIWSAIWMEEHFPIEEGTDFVSSFLYYLASVGLREELCKLLLFTPFLFRVLKPGRDLEALLFGALVGLGFAIEENISYFADYELSGTVITRFVSANLLHLTLTAITSLALTRALREPEKWLVDGLQTLLMAIGLHGIYNTLLSSPIPGVGDMSYFSGTALVGCAVLFFREVETLSPSHPSLLSRTALFCWGFCLLFNLELLQGILTMPFKDALSISGQSALAAIMTGYIFIHMIKEPLSA